MRSIIVLGLVAGTLISTAAQASVEGCAQTLLQSPNDALYANLQVTASQVQQIGWIRASADSQRAQLQAQLNVAGDDGQVAALESQLASIDSNAVASVMNVMTPWQQDQCSDQGMVVAPAPVIVTAPVPVPIYRRPVIVRPVPRYPVAYPPVVRRPVYVPAPVVRRPVYSPAPVVHRAPVAVHVSAPAAHPRWQPAPSVGHRRYF